MGFIFAAIAEWEKAGLNVETAVKHGIYTVKETLVSRQFLA